MPAGSLILSIIEFIAPRFLAKFVSSAYRPLDSDIVREAWVKGDLKTQLGIPRRKQRSTQGHGQDVESTPIYTSHQRSTSETSRGQDGYQPAPMRSPNDPGIEMSPQVVGYSQNNDDEPPRWRDSTSSVRPDIRYIVDGEPEDGLATPVASRTPVSPRPSYYSVSDLPPPSPLPAPRYSYYNRDGLIVDSGPPTATGTSAPSSPGPTQSLQPPRVDIYGGGSSPPHTQAQQYQRQQQESYEMQVRSLPPSSFPSRFQQPSPNHRASSRASEVSQYATASEQWTDAESIASDDDYRRLSTVSVNAPRAV